MHAFEEKSWGEKELDRRARIIVYVRTYIHTYIQPTDSCQRPSFCLWCRNKYISHVYGKTMSLCCRHFLMQMQTKGNWAICYPLLLSYNKSRAGMSTFVSSVVSAIRQRPTLFNGVTGGGLFAGSDAMAQELESKGLASTHDSSCESFNNRRFFSTIAIGVFIGGFIYPSAYKRLDKLWPGKDWKTIMKKSVVEIFSVGILVNSISMISRGLMVGRETHHVAHHTINELPEVTKNDFFVWLPYNVVAFSVIPYYIRPTTTALMEASWQTYISNRSHDYVPVSVGQPHQQPGVLQSLS